MPGSPPLKGASDLRILMVGDICGRPGRDMLRETLPEVRRQYSVDFTIVNGENAAAGFGLTKSVYEEIRAAGADVVTLGNHTWDKREIMGFIDEEPELLRPINYPPGAPGRGAAVFTRGKVRILVANAMGRVFSGVHLECPFRALDDLLEGEGASAHVRIVDFHAEATSEKEAMGWFLDGRVTGIFGTHTHIQTADARVLPGGTAYLTDVGMTGPSESVLGMKKEIIIERFLSQLPARFEVAEGKRQFSAVVVTAEPETGRALEVERIFIRE